MTSVRVGPWRLVAAELVTACALAMALAPGLTLGLAGRSARAASIDPNDLPLLKEMLATPATEALAPVDFGPGRGKPRPAAKTMMAASKFVSASARAVSAQDASDPVPVPIGGSDAGVNGFYDQPLTWPIIPIHMALLPDGRVMSYGSDETGLQGAQLYYDVWDPSQRYTGSGHTVLPNTTNTDIFCSGLSLMWTTGDLMVTGGDHREIKKSTTSNNQTAIFDPPTNTLTAVTPMNFPRWYGTLVALPSGDMLAMGGVQFRGKSTSGGGELGNAYVSASTPEVYVPGVGWQALTTATSDAAFFTKTNWFYPRGYVAPNGKVFVFGNTPAMYWLDPTGTGTLTQTTGTLPNSFQQLPSVMYQPGKILALRGINTTNAAVLIDITGDNPVVTPIAPTYQKRWWSNATLMADGKVLINGGSSTSNQLVGLAYQNEIFDPATQTFTLGAIASKPRLYHSNAILLPDGSVLTGGGGAPGPVRNLNTEIFYPPYLYLNDGSGNPAPRPSLQTDGTPVLPGGQIVATVGAADQIGRVTLVKFGAATHSVNTDQRFTDLAFFQSGQSLQITLPSNPNFLLPGYYMLFAFNTAGTPSVSSTVVVEPPIGQLPARAARQMVTLARRK